MKTLIIAIVSTGLALAAWFTVAGITDNSQRGAAIEAGQKLDRQMQADQRDADRADHVATCRLHIGNRAALKLHGCNPDGTVKQIVNSDGTVSDAPDGAR